MTEQSLLQNSTSDTQRDIIEEYSTSHFKDEEEIMLEIPKNPELEITERDIIDEDIAEFTNKLEKTIINFRTESLKEFIRTKRHLLIQHVHQINGLKLRYEGMLDESQIQLEYTKKQLALCADRNRELEGQRDVLGLWLCKSRRKKVLFLFRSFIAWRGLIRRNRGYVKILEMKLEGRNKYLLRKAMDSWIRRYKIYKKKKDEELLQKNILNERNLLSIEYGKEIENLQLQVKELKMLLDQTNTQKLMIQENLKKAFIRGVSAMNYEASNIINSDTANNITETSAKSEISSINDLDLLTLDLTESPNKNPSNIMIYEAKAESKEHLWKPAPHVKQNLGEYMKEVISANRAPLYQNKVSRAEKYSTLNKSEIILGEHKIEKSIECKRIKNNYSPINLSYEEPIPSNNLPKKHNFHSKDSNLDILNDQTEKLTGNKRNKRVKEEGKVIRVTQKEKTKVEIRSNTPQPSALHRGSKLGKKGEIVVHGGAHNAKLKKGATPTYVNKIMKFK